MGLYGLTGFIIGFIIGMIINARLLRNVPREKYRTDKSMRLRFGLLNWGIALIGLVAGFVIKSKF
jgi:hypothetical protein